MTTPFATAPQTWPGLATPKSLNAPPGSARFWLGKPGQMVQLPAPTNGYDAPPQLGEVVHGLAGGGSAVTLLARDPHRSWTLNFVRLAGRDWQVVYGFYRRIVAGRGPWAFLPPEDVNRLPLTESMCGGRDGEVGGWFPSAGAVAAATATSPMLPSGVLAWTGRGATCTLTVGSGVSEVDPTVAVPYVPAEPLCVSVWLWASAPVTGAVQAVGYDATGATVVTHIDQPVAITTTPRQFSAVCGPGDLGASALAGLRISTTTAASATVYIACADVRLTSDPGPWEAGNGVPRVIWSAAGTRTVNESLSANTVMTLLEV